MADNNERRPPPFPPTAAAVAAAVAQHHDLQSLVVETFHCPSSQKVGVGVNHRRSQEEAPTLVLLPRLKKAKRRRKRHAPPGPAGVWFQSQQLHQKQQQQQQQQQQQKSGSAGSIAGTDHDVSSSTTDGSSSSSRHNNTRRQASTTDLSLAAAVADVSSCPAWACMQHSLGIRTPYLPAYCTAEQRYEQLREHIPREYLLLPEVKQYSFDELHTNKQLIVLVHSAAMLYHEYWTVELRDETGTVLQGWMSPEFDYPRHGHLLQMGVVWLLRDLCLDSKWILVTKENIQQAWTPQQASQELSDASFIEWMTRRSQLTTEQQARTTADSDNDGPTENPDDDDDDDEEEERETRTHDNEEENDDRVLLPRNMVSQVVTPHPSNATRHADGGAAANLVLPPSRQQPQSTPSHQRDSPSQTAHPSQESSVISSRTVSSTTLQRQENPTVNIVSQFLVPNSASNANTVGLSQRTNDPPPSQNPYANHNCRGTMSGNKESTHPSNSGSPSPRPAPKANDQARRVSLSQFSTPSLTSNGYASSSQANHSMNSSNTRPVGPDENVGIFSKFAAATARTAQCRQFDPTAQRETDGATSVVIQHRESVPAFSSKRPGGTCPQNRTAESIGGNAKKVPPTAPAAKSSDNLSILSQFVAVPVRSPTVAVGRSKPPPLKTSTSNGTLPKPAKRAKSQKSPNTSAQSEPIISQLKVSPKQPSKLWLGAGMSQMMGMLDEADGDELDGKENISLQSMPKSVAPRAADPRDPPTTLANPEPSSLFQASAFAGISVDDLFDEED